ncbi:Eco57I restriction-modification methylase domain-containing protein [Ralstonia pseudosolanacearum]|uniref:Eco57I restriction-modification methylase domain-containing protein n=1 Tax=Ralstonia pseudosolanacearum TaxID=1310165 RepID=UPI0026771E98|nr:DNA methyltransferase [Ralstonia pseudosolanacearum]MDO3535951.1 SAM-dependent DNA methyltransferase [Ralstonia pseudosolanacearum]
MENTVKVARDVAEKGAGAVLAQMAVAEAKAPDYLTDELKALRRRLRAHGRALGDVKAGDDAQDIQHLVWEVAYEHWHRMLFARFLAENGLLLWEPGAAVSLDDCESLVQEADPAMNLGAKTKWELAGKLAARMLPQVFKPHSPVFEVTFAPEHQRELERLLAALPPEVFKASDSLGWVYQYWQAKRKDEVNASEVKIGADELPAVTQLFTEPYMVDFLLHNSLGAWWVTRHPGKTCPVPLTYLRTLENGTPAAGKFEGWPDCLQDFKLLDPCCGSGHFLVAAFLILVPMRMEAEGLSATAAVDAVLTDNLHGLELDARCVEIAVFALALAAWRFPDENGDPLGVRAEMPAPRVACCGMKVASKSDDWMALVPDEALNAAYLRQELRLLHASFAQAPLLGSLLDPARSLRSDLATSSFDTLRDMLERALGSERPVTLRGQTSELQDDTWDLALTARGLLDAAQLLNARYHLVVTNVPYLARGRQNGVLKDYIEAHYPEAKNDLANVFLERCLELTHEPKGSKGTGVVQIVMPQNWLFLSSYTKQRESLLNRVQWNLLARLGPRAFETISGEVVQAILLTQTRVPAAEDFQLRGLDASVPKVAQEKAELLRNGEIVAASQKMQLLNPDARVVLEATDAGELLARFATSPNGMHGGDSPRFRMQHWELPLPSPEWRRFQSPVDEPVLYGGRDSIFFWPDDGMIHLDNPNARVQGQSSWGRAGVAVRVMKHLPCTIYTGEMFDISCSPVTPFDKSHLAAIWCFCSSSEYNEAVRQIDQKLNVTNATLVKVPFNLEHWQQVAAERYPNGLPEPYSDDPTQWLFHGHPRPATDQLQVAVARLAGYRWPGETDTAMELANEARAWITHCDKLAEHADDDGIVCLPSVRGEPPAHERLLKLLISASETVQPGSWKPAVLDKLLADADCAGKGLEVWLRDKFFEQHARRFHHRPFIWHVWDGLKDGFAALVNYHRLDAKNLERLIHTYLGDWIRQQEAGVRDGVDGAQTRLAAAQDLKRRLVLILEGEAPYDIFVRWKTLAEQAIGWNPDLNDGVRLNIRPFMTAEALRHNKKPKLNITWDKDRGKDVESAPWFKAFKGERINDHHLTVAEKHAARKASRD